MNKKNDGYDNDNSIWNTIHVEESQPKIDGVNRRAYRFWSTDNLFLIIVYLSGKKNVSISFFFQTLSNAKSSDLELPCLDRLIYYNIRKAAYRSAIVENLNAIIIR